MVSENVYYLNQINNESQDQQFDTLTYLGSYFGINNLLKQIPNLLNLIIDKNKQSKSIINNFHIIKIYMNNKLLIKLLNSCYEYLSFNLKIEVDCYYQTSKYHDLFCDDVINYTKLNNDLINFILHQHVCTIY